MQWSAYVAGRKIGVGLRCRGQHRIDVDSRDRVELGVVALDPAEARARHFER